MKLIEYEPCEGLAINNPMANSCHSRYALATKLQTEYLITLGERLKTKTWFVNGNHASFVLKKVGQAQRVINFYRDKRGY